MSDSHAQGTIPRTSAGFPHHQLKVVVCSDTVACGISGSAVQSRKSFGELSAQRPEGEREEVACFIA
jgi:hypothetical protein